MKEGPILAALGIIMLIMVLSSVVRMREIRSDSESARIKQSQRVSMPPSDPTRFSGLRFSSHGRNPSPMVFIPAEKVVRGTDEEVGEFDEKPARIVTLSPYLIDLKEVAHAQYQKFIEQTGRHKQEVMVFYDDVALLYAPTLPAVGVSWFDAQDYCAWNGKRLPTEAEWEYAAGGNGRGTWPWGETFLAGYANIRDGEDGFAYTAPVGSYEAGRSNFGLYETAGNVGEWVEDWYDEFFYKEGQVTLPKGPNEGSTKVVRGGSWDQSANDTRTTKRVAVAPHRKEATIGFRCVMDAPL